MERGFWGGMTAPVAERPPPYPHGGGRGRRRSVRRYPAACAAVGGGLLAPQAFGRSPIEVPCLPPLSCGGGTGAREPPPFSGRYPAAVGEATEVWGVSGTTGILIPRGTSKKLGGRSRFPVSICGLRHVLGGVRNRRDFIPRGTSQRLGG